MAKTETKVDAHPTKQLSVPSKIPVSPVPTDTLPSAASPSKNLRSIPEDYAFDSSRSVVCCNLPSSAKKGEIAAFFKDSLISLGPDYSSKVTF
jgi:hypothetical protein